MDFDLTDEQRLLKDSVDRLFADSYGDLEQRRRIQAEPRGWSEPLWNTYAGLGLLGLPFDEEHGGFAGGPVETMIVMQAIGSTLAVEPYLSTVVLGGGLIRLGGSEAQRQALLPRIAEGALRVAFAHSERQSRYDLQDVGTTARRVEAGWQLDGEKSLVLHGDSAGLLLVSARTAGGRRDEHGITLFLVDADAPGLQCRAYRTQDGQRAAELSLTGVTVAADAVLGAVDGALPLIEQAQDGAIAAVCAEAVGAMEALHALTVDYLKTRKQFGTTIGSFQALQHQAVDMMIALQQAQSMAIYAAMMASSPDRQERSAAISAAKVQVNRSARQVGQQAVQLHGGIGMTMDYKAGHLFKRLTMIESLFGDTDYHLHRLDQAGGLANAADVRTRALF